MTTATNPSAAAPKLKRVLGLWDLVFYGIVLVQPIAAIPLFGIASQVSQGHMVTTLLIAMAGMLLTAISYGRLASLFPSAGSAYTYVGKGLNPYAGFMAGWAMVLDYMIIPIINTIYASFALQRLIPTVPFFVWIVMFIIIITFLNLRGVKTVAGSNKLMLAVMCAVIGIFLVLAVQYIFETQGWDGLFSSEPFYNPATFDFGHIMTATSFAALTYIGFDGITTLAEDVKNPRRNLLWAPVLVCLITGLFSGLQVYLAQQVWPDYNSFTNAETGFFDVAARVGGDFLFGAVAFILIVASLGSGLAGQLGAARLLYAMGRDGVLPKKLFSYLSPKSSTPVYNILIVAFLTLAGALFLGYQNAAELLNFGAFLAFMAVNIAAFRQFFFLQKVKSKRNILRDGLLPVLGFLVCFVIWVSLPASSKILGAIWFLIGLVYLIIKTKGLKKAPDTIDFNNQ